MVISRADRRAGREQRARDAFGTEADAALDLLELVEFAWHDCFGDVTPPDDVVDDLFVVAHGNLAALVRAARLAVQDYRDVRLWADEVRSRTR